MLLCICIALGAAGREQHLKVEGRFHSWSVEA